MGPGVKKNPSPPGVVGMAICASEADLDTIVPDGDEDNVCEEGVKLMARRCVTTTPGTP